MARHEDAPDLFGAGVGSATYANITCGWCGKKYLDREHEDGEPKADSEAIRVAYLGNLQVCECCFERIESAVLARMTDIIPWYLRILKAQMKNLETRKEQVGELFSLLRELLDKPKEG